MKFGFRKQAASLALLAFCVAGAVLTTAARAEAPDTSTPKKAAVAFANALTAGDMDAVHKLATGNDAQFALVKSLSDVIQGFKHLDAASTKKFGDAGKLPKEMSMDIAADFASAEEKIDGDKATLVLKSKPDDQFPPTLKKTGDSWIMDLSNMDKDPSAAEMTKMLPTMTKGLETVAKNIDAGKYKTFAEAMADLQTQMMGGAPTATDPAK